MTNRLTKEQYERLQPYEKHIRAAYKNSFVHVSATDFQNIADIFAEITGTPLRKSQMSCNTCRLNTMKKLGEMYEAYEQNEQEKRERKERRKKLTEDNG